jgi:hypothetical protein
MIVRVFLALLLLHELVRTHTQLNELGLALRLRPDTVDVLNIQVLLALLAFEVGYQ